MKNFSMTKKVVVAATMLAFCSGQFDAYGTDTENNQENKHTAIINDMP
jgi:hypothetical protein